MPSELAIIIHGGVLSTLEVKENAKRLPVLKDALHCGWRRLAEGAPGEEAVVSALRVLEACEYFDAGYGAFPNEDGEVFLDAAIMRGDGTFSSLLNIQGVMFPSELVLEILRAKDSRMRVWNEKLMRWLKNGSSELRHRVGFNEDPRALISPYAKQVSDSYQKKTATGPVLGTVGCVVRDSTGMIVAGTSTGGTPAKPAGRIGDAPLIGVGTFADATMGGFSATGHGEAIMCSALPGFVIAELRALTAETAATSEISSETLITVLARELQQFKNKYPTSSAGLIMLPVRGLPVFQFIGAGMSVAARAGTASAPRYELCDVISC